MTLVVYGYNKSKFSDIWQSLIGYSLICRIKFHRITKTIHSQTKIVYTNSIINFVSFVAKVSFRQYRLPPVRKKNKIRFFTLATHTGHI